MSEPLQPAVNGTDQRLDALLAELRGLRADLRPPPAAPATDDVIELREPVRGKGGRQRATA